MEIFGIGPFELVAILVLGLIVLGPERLPEVGRFLGRQLAKLLAWQQQSPEAQMLQQIRQDLEQEIVDLRDEIVRARQQLDVSQDMQRLREETRSLLSLKESPPGSIATTQTTGVPPSLDDVRVSAARLPNKVNGSGQSDSVMEPASPPDTAAPDAVQLASAELEPPTGVATDDSAELSIAERRRKFFEDENLDAYRFTPTANGAVSATSDGDAGAPAQPVDYDALQRQLQTLMADLYALQDQLRVRGLLDSDWQPPSRNTTPETVSHD